MRRCNLILPGMLLLAGRCLGADLVAGPMVGHVTDRSARIWMQFPIAGQVTVTALEVERGQRVSSLRTDIQGPTPFICDMPLNNLEPDHSYRIEVEFDGTPVRIPRPEVVIRTAPMPGVEEPFTLAFGSGLNPDGRGSAPSLKAIGELKPRIFLFLGNCGYLPARLEDFPTARRQAFRFICDLHSRVRREPDLTDLIHTAACYGVYGERDFGTPGADRSFVFAPESLLAFQRFWPNPDWGTPQHPGCYSQFTFGDADFFLLDARTFRDPAGAAAPRALLGAPQLEWLEKGLKESRAAFKILACATPLLPAPPEQTPDDSWSRFPEEQQSFLRWLGDKRIGGLVFLAGNLPSGQLTRLDPPGAADDARAPAALASPLPYPLFTLGTSTLGPVPSNPNATLPGHVQPPPGPQSVTADNFGTLDFGGQREHRFVTLRLHDETGKTRLEQTLFAVQLK